MYARKVQTMRTRGTLFISPLGHGRHGLGPTRAAPAESGRSSAWLLHQLMGLSLAVGLGAPSPVRAQDPSAGEPTAADVAQGGQPGGDVPQETYSQEETLAAAQKFFGGTTSGLRLNRPAYELVTSV